VGEARFISAKKKKDLLPEGTPPGKSEENGALGSSLLLGEDSASRKVTLARQRKQPGWTGRLKNCTLLLNQSLLTSRGKYPPKTMKDTQARILKRDGRTPRCKSLFFPLPMKRKERERPIRGRTEKGISAESDGKEKRKETPSRDKKRKKSNSTDEGRREGVRGKRRGKDARYPGRQKE